MLPGLNCRGKENKKQKRLLVENLASDSIMLFSNSSRNHQNGNKNSIIYYSVFSI